MMIVDTVIVLILIILIAILPKLSNKNKFRVKLIVSGLINKLILFTIIGLTVLENKLIGLLLLVLLFSALNLNIDKENHIEGFTSYYN
jgi:hypothetical protein